MVDRLRLGAVGRRAKHQRTWVCDQNASARWAGGCLCLWGDAGVALPAEPESGISKRIGHSLRLHRTPMKLTG
jgi:hypothetical protein